MGMRTLSTDASSNVRSVDEPITRLRKVLEVIMIPRKTVAYCLQPGAHNKFLVTLLHFS